MEQRLQKAVASFFAESAQKAQPAVSGCRQEGSSQQLQEQVQVLQGQSAAKLGWGRPAGAATAGQAAAMALKNGRINRAADQRGRQPGGRIPQAGRR